MLLAALSLAPLPLICPLTSAPVYCAVSAAEQSSSSTAVHTAAHSLTAAAAAMSAPTPSAIIAARSTPQNAAHIRLGYAAFNSGQYEEAMMYFQLTEADPLQVEHSDRHSDGWTGGGCDGAASVGQLLNLACVLLAC